MKSASVLLQAIFCCAVAACSSTVPPDKVRTDPIRNDLGHVIGHTTPMKDTETGQTVLVSTYYMPRYDEKGDLIGYEERVPEGVVIRSLEGRRIGVRRNDLRSRADNPNNAGVSVIVSPNPRME